MQSATYAVTEVYPTVGFEPCFVSTAARRATYSTMDYPETQVCEKMVKHIDRW